MKKVLLSGAFALSLVSMFFSSCKKEVPVSDTKTNALVKPVRFTARFGNNFSEYQSEIQSICDWHNDAMDFWYAYVTNLKNNGYKATDAAFDSLMRVKLDSFFQSHSLNTVPFVNDAPPANLPTLSQAAGQIIYALDSVVDLYGAGGVDINTLTAYCDSRFADCYNLADPDESDQVGVYCGMIKNSGIYWKDKLEDCIILYDGDVPEPAAMNSKQKATLKADAHGAFWGGVSGAAEGPLGIFVGALFNGAYQSAKEAYAQSGHPCTWCP